MIAHTLRDNQSEVLATKLKGLLPKITEETLHKTSEDLLHLLEECKPNPGRTWAMLFLDKEKSDLIEVLCKLAWGMGSSKPTSKASN